MSLNLNNNYNNGEAVHVTEIHTYNDNFRYEFILSMKELVTIYSTLVESNGGNSKNISFLIDEISGGKRNPYLEYSSSYYLDVRYAIRNIFFIVKSVTENKNVNEFTSTVKESLLANDWEIEPLSCTSINIITHVTIYVKENIYEI